MKTKMDIEGGMTMEAGNLLQYFTTHGKCTTSFSKTAWPLQYSEGVFSQISSGWATEKIGVAQINFAFIQIMEGGVIC